MTTYAMYSVMDTSDIQDGYYDGIHFKRCRISGGVFNNCVFEDCQIIPKLGKKLNEPRFTNCIFDKECA